MERDAGNQMNPAVMVYKSKEMTGYVDNGIVEGLRLRPQREYFDCWINQLRCWDLVLIKNISVDRRPGIESRCGRYYPHHPGPALGTAQPPIQ